MIVSACQRLFPHGGAFPAERENCLRRIKSRFCIIAAAGIVSAPLSSSESALYYHCRRNCVSSAVIGGKRFVLSLPQESCQRRCHRQKALCFITAAGIVSAPLSSAESALYYHCRRNHVSAAVIGGKPLLYHSCRKSCVSSAVIGGKRFVLSLPQESCQRRCHRRNALCIITAAGIVSAPLSSAERL